MSNLLKYNVQYSTTHTTVILPHLRCKVSYRRQRFDWKLTRIGSQELQERTLVIITITIAMKKNIFLYNHCCTRKETSSFQSERARRVYESCRVRKSWKNSSWPNGFGLHWNLGSTMWIPPIVGPLFLQWCLLLKLTMQIGCHWIWTPLLFHLMQTLAVLKDILLTHHWWKQGSIRL